MIALDAVAPGDLFDTHAHLDAFPGEVDAVLARARARGVRFVATVGCVKAVDEARAAVELATSHEGVVAAVGVHPHDARFADAAVMAAVAEAAGDSRVVAVGETGLDYFYDHSPREAQREALRAHLRLATELGKPVILHLRDAHDDTMEILRDEGVGPAGGIVHCFSGGPRELADFLPLGLHVSLSGIVTFPGRSRDDIRAAAREIPIDRLLVETDCPYLAPVPQRGAKNEPAFVADTAAFVAALRGEDPGELAAQTTRNALQLYRMA